MSIPPNDKRRQAFPGPTEVRYLLELTSAYARGLQDVLGVIEEALREAHFGGAQYSPLLEHLHKLLSPGAGSLVAVQRECRVLLGLEEG